MQVNFALNFDEAQFGNDQTKIDFMLEAVRFAMSGAMHEFRDGAGRHAQVVDYEIDIHKEI